MINKPGIVSRVYSFITFANMKIRQKFLLFSLGVATWFLILAVLGWIATDVPLFRNLLLFMTLTAAVLLIFFGYWLSRSVSDPINEMIEQIDSLTEGEVDLSRKIAVTSGDELGTLSSSFNRLLETIHDMNTFKKVIEEDDAPSDVYKRLGTAFESLGLKTYHIYEVSNSKNTMKPVHAFSDMADSLCSRDILVNCNLCRAKKTGAVVSSLEYPGICKQFLGGGEYEHICVPMIIGDSTGGVSQIFFTEEQCNPHPAELLSRVSRASMYIKEALPVLEAKRLMDTLKESSLRDSMTGLYNRRFLEEYSETLVATTLRRKTTLGLLMCDLDFFKEVNDTYGHNIGDLVLKETADIIKTSVRASDMVIRFGGEEFLAVLQDAKDGESVEIAEKIRQRMEETKVKLPRGFIQKTISVGVCEFPKDTKNFWQAIKFSDISLYKAKNDGRNRVVRFTKDLWTNEEY